MGRLIAELRRRNVFRVAGAYLIVSWLILQVVTLVESPLSLPEWTDTLAIVMLALAFPIALILAWAFDMTADGVRRTSEGLPDGLTTPAKAQRADYLILTGLLGLIALIGWQQIAQAPVSTAEAERRFSEDPGPTENSETFTATPDNSIAVLPFADLSVTGDKRYFADGIAEEILNVLARIDEFEVASRTSAFAFRSRSELSVPDIAASLNVKYVLEGSIRTSGNRIRIASQLIDAASDQHLWSDTFDATLTADNIFSIQDKIARSISQEMSVRLGFAAAPSVAPVASSTQELSAYEAFLEGQDLFINRNYEKLQPAIAALESAVRVDPQFSRAWGILAMAYGVAPQWNFTDRDYVSLSTDAAQRALAITPNNADAFTALGLLNTRKQSSNFSQAIEMYERAIAIDPKATTALLWLAQSYRELGYFKRAESEIERCLDIDPEYPACLYTHAQIAGLLGDYQSALQRLLPLLATSHQEAYPLLLGVAAKAGDEVTVSLMLREMADLIGPDMRWILPEVRRALSNEVYDRAGALKRLEARIDAMAPGGVAAVDGYIASGYRMAFRAYDRMPANPAAGWWWAVSYPGLREAPARKQEMIDRNLFDHWRRYGFPEQCRPIGNSDFECN